MKITFGKIIKKNTRRRKKLWSGVWVSAYKNSFR